MKNQLIYKAEDRGHANHGWLNTYHTFSFAGYRDPKRMNFGVLRVVNDDTVAAGMGFGTHPHENMEIISIPLSGELEHRDSMGNGGIIKPNEVQIMSAGTGIQHSEFNPNENEESKFFQIWLFPDKRDVKPRYQQITLDPVARQNKWDQLISPDKDEKGGWIHQNAWFNMADLEAGKSLNYTLKDQKNGIFLFVVEGSIDLGDHHLQKRDAIGLWETDSVTFKATESSTLLAMEVPMELPDYLKK